MNSKPMIQSIVQNCRRIVPRGWSPALAALARICVPLQTYRIRLADNDRLFVDLREQMCHGYFYYGGLPHEVGTERLLKAVLREGATFVDCGANVGYFTRMASSLVGPTGTVIAVEPSPPALRLLRLNASKNVIIHNVALGTTRDVTTFYVRQKGDRS